MLAGCKAGFIAGFSDLHCIRLKLSEENRIPMVPDNRTPMYILAREVWGEGERVREKWVCMEI